MSARFLCSKQSLRKSFSDNIPQRVFPETVVFISVIVQQFCKNISSYGHGLKHDLKFFFCWGEK